MSAQEQINYSIENTHDCIVQDNRRYAKYTDDDKVSLYNEKLKILEGNNILKEMIDIDYIQKYNIEGVDNFNKIGVIPPELVITDDRIREMCGYQFWIAYRNAAERRFTKCPGLGKHSSCPDFSPNAEQMQKLLDGADVFVVLQSKLVNFENGVDWQYDTINKFEDDLNERLGKGTVIKKFGAGPCQVCPPGDCLQNGDCEHPDKRTSALEACGVPVGQLCKDMALLQDNDDWKITWLKHWGFPHQEPDTWRLTFGAARKIN